MNYQQSTSFDRLITGNRRHLTRNTLGSMLNLIKQRMNAEKDPYKRQCWAEVGIELNKIFIEL